MSSGITRRDIEEIIAELGLQCQLVTNKDEFHWSSDPDIVVLLDPGSPFSLNEKLSGLSNRMFDAALYYGAIMNPIIYRKNTKPAIRKWLRDQSDPDDECSVCFEPVRNGNMVACTICNTVVCTFCTLKMSLKPEKCYNFSRLNTSWMIESQCVGCRSNNILHLKEMYYEVMDQLDHFHEAQRNMLLFLKEADPEYKKKRCLFKKARASQEEMKRIRFRKGCRVVLQGLKSKKQWNGKEAMIVGKRIIKNNVIRWPIKLLDGSNSDALLKPKNMQNLYL